MALTADQAARLAKLQAAYDALITGQQVVRVEFNGRQTTFGPGDTTKLKAEIDELNAVAATRTGRRNGAVRFAFR
jgi:hypothetical protein